MSMPAPSMSASRRGRSLSCSMVCSAGPSGAPARIRVGPKSGNVTTLNPNDGCLKHSAGT
jgi:hypothetical protein